MTMPQAVPHPREIPGEHPGKRLSIGTYDYDDDLMAATARDGISRLRVYRLDAPAVVIGRAGDPGKEISAPAVVSGAVPVLRRPGGGCAVVIDPGNVIVSLVMKREGFGRISDLNGEISRWMIDGLARAGAPGIELRGHSDLVADDKKIAGACLYRTKDLVYYSATLLVDPDTRLMEAYLPHPPREPAYRRGRAHGDFVGSLKDLRGITDISAFMQRLRAALATPPSLISSV